MSIGWRCGLAVLSGVLDALGYIGFGFYPLTWIAKVPVLIAVKDSSVKQSFWLGLLYGVVAHLGGYYWLAETLADFGGLSLVVSMALLLLIAAFFALLFALLLGLVQRARCTLGIAPVWTLMVAYPALEFIFPNALPYNIGASQYRFTAITQIVEVTGLLGLTALIGMVNGAFYELVEARWERRRPVLLRWFVPVVGFLLVLGYGMIRVGQVDASIKSARHLTVGLIQTNHSARDQSVSRREVVERHREMTMDLIKANPGMDFVVWPETVLITSISELEPFGRRLEIGRPLVTGAFVRGDGERFFNSMITISAEGNLVGRFDKRRLIPFSETIPLVGTFPQLERFHLRGKVIQQGMDYLNLRVAGVSALPMICYEDIVPGFVREMWHRAGPAEILINVSNDSWFGDSHEPIIHLALASFRSIETRRSLIRATSTGISAFVDPVGRIVSRTGQWQSETLVGHVALVEAETFTIYLRYGDMLGWICLVLTGAGLAATLPPFNRRFAV